MFSSARAADKVDLVRVDKSERRMELLAKGQVLRTYSIALGANPIGHKQQQGDERTPEGRYVLDWRNANSCCMRSLHISYPNDADKAAARQLGVDPGGMIMIHGQVNGYGWWGWLIQLFDWTNGCIAVNDADMREIWDMVAGRHADRDRPMSDDSNPASGDKPGEAKRVEDRAIWPEVEPIAAGLKGRCPRCGEGRLFSGFLTVGKRCTNCGLDYSFADAGDGPAVFVILIIGFVVVGLALWTEVTLNPPLWLHFIIWIPLALVLCLTALRLIKGVLITLQYRNKAQQGRVGQARMTGTHATRPDRFPWVAVILGLAGHCGC